MNPSNALIRRDTKAWRTQVWLSFGIAISLCAIGLAWLVLTLVFEFTLGRLLGMDWQRLLDDYDLRHGGLMSFGMLVLLLAPLAAERIRKRLRERKAG